MADKREKALATTVPSRDPFAVLRQMTSELDRFFDEPGLFRWPKAFAPTDAPAWAPGIDVFEKDGHLVTKVDLPGLKKEDVKVEVADGHLVISGERRSEAVEQKEQFYRRERQYGSFYRAVPLPDGTKVEDVKATFADGVLEVGVPLAARAEPKPHRVEIKEPEKAARTAA